MTGKEKEASVLLFAIQDFIIDLNADMIWIFYNEYWRLCRGTEY
jgi:hypothetical protein